MGRPVGSAAGRAAPVPERGRHRHNAGSQRWPRRWHAASRTGVATRPTSRGRRRCRRVRRLGRYAEAGRCGRQRAVTYCADAAAGASSVNPRCEFGQCARIAPCQVHRSAGWQVASLAGCQVGRLPGWQVQRLAGCQVAQFKGCQVQRLAATQVGRFKGWHVHRLDGCQVYRLAGFKVRRFPGSKSAGLRGRQRGRPQAQPARA